MVLNIGNGLPVNFCFWTLFQWTTTKVTAEIKQLICNIYNDKNNPGTCDIGDTDYNSDNWESEFMTIFVTWQLRFVFRNLDNLKDSDIGDTDYNSDNREPKFMTIIVTWQLIVTLDSICNYCDVLFYRIRWLSINKEINMRKF